MRFALRVHQGGWQFAQLRACWQEAERLGYDGASLNDLLGVDGPECWTALTALAAATERMVSIPLVLSAPYRHPVLVAKMAATLDQATGGRVLLGLGAGGSGSDARAFGVPWAPLRARVEALEEAVDVMRLLWAGGGTYAGQHYQLADAKGAPQPAQPGGPPILIGGHGPRYLLPAVARKADLCNIGFDLDVAGWARQRAVLDELAGAAGRALGAVGMTHNATVLIAEDAAGVDAAITRMARARGRDPEQLRARLGSALVGTPAQIIERLRALAAAGVAWVFLVFPELPSLDGVRLFGEAVLPVFAGAGAA